MFDQLRRDVASVTEFVRSYWTGPLSSRDPALADLLGLGPTSTGVSVSSETAYNSSAFWSAVSIVAGDVASLPLEVFKRDKDGANEPYVASKTYELVHDNPNPEMTSLVFREALQGHVMTWGNAYAEIERDGANRPLALWPITPDRVVAFRNSTRAVQYRVRNQNQGDTILDASNMLHVPGLGFDGLIGYSVIEKARDSISMGLAMQRFGGSFFGNGSTFGGILSHPQNLTKETKQAIRESLDAVHSGVDRAHKFVILGGGMSYTKLGIPPNDAQFLESRRFEIEEIARWFHMPQHKLNGLDHATFSNIEHLDLEYYKSCLRGWLVRWEQELNRKLISPLERKSQYFKHNVEGVLRGDSASRAAFYKEQFSVGAISINEIRELENRNGIGPDGDEYFVPANFVPVKLALNPPAKPLPSVTDVTPAEPKALPPKRAEDFEAELREARDAREAAEALAAKAQDDHACEAKARLEAEARERETDAACALAEATAAQALALVEETEARRIAIVEEARQLTEAATAAQEARDAAQSAVTPAREAQDVAEKAAVVLSLKLGETEQRVEAAEQAVKDAAAALGAQRAAEIERLSGMVTAHRALIVDAMGRMVRMETNRARKHQATPEKLRSWADAFYVTHEDTCLEALRPAIRAHLAWKQSADDVDAVMLAFVTDHIAESRAQLLALADGVEPDDLPGMLERMLQKWEQHRPEALADRVLKDELEYLRRIH